MADDGFVKVAQVSEISPGEMISVDFSGDAVLVANVDGTIRACDDICSHAYASLSEGDLNGEEVECPLHGALFNITTGEALTPPADAPVKVYKVQVRRRRHLRGAFGRLKHPVGGEGVRRGRPYTAAVAENRRRTRLRFLLFQSRRARTAPLRGSSRTSRCGCHPRASTRARLCPGCSPPARCPRLGSHCCFCGCRL